MQLYYQLFNVVRLRICHVLRSWWLLDAVLRGTRILVWYMVWRRFWELLVTLSASETYGIFLAEYSKTPLIRIIWDGEPSRYAENPDNWIFLCIDSLKFGCYYLQHVPASKPRDHAWFEVLVAKYCTVLDPITGNFKAS